ncbi:M15 family metallopeptidase [Cellulomonas sp. ES6]|uniref:M15 family metallopeptidase n=1 Tax=Cellulomonas sp. ES6 TaxID=3039384 RepID=UPI0024B83641|nr:M15 family metallopeptidase [Cellulomonas sp. ES6]WHP16942.1 M15 family metallopeptidase [Cellulomonas sp. ES6]
MADAAADSAADAAADEGATTTSGTVGAPDPSPTATGGTGDDATTEAQPEDPATARITAAVERVSTLTAELQVVTQRTQEAAAAAAEAARKEAQRTSLDSYANGQIPSSALCELGFAPGQQLRCDAAEALEQLDVAFTAAFGTHLVITDSYRSYGQQVACRQQKGSLCATPGTSNHGTGTAVDLGATRTRSAPTSTTGCWRTPRSTAGRSRTGPASAAPSPSRGTGSTSADARGCGPRAPDLP